MAFGGSSANQSPAAGVIVAEQPGTFVPKPTVSSMTSRPMRTVRFLAAIAAIWFVVALLSSFQGYMSGVAHGDPKPWLPAFGTSLLWYAGWTVVTPLVMAMARRFSWPAPSLLQFGLAHAVGILLTGVVHAAVYSALAGLFHGHDPAGPSSVELVFLRLASHGHVYVLFYTIIVGIVLSAQTYRRLRDRDVDAAHLEARLAEAETAALRAQLQPHFLFNTLNAISALVPSDPVTAQRLIARLGDLLRLSMEQHRAPQSTFADEMEFTDSYLAIEEARLGDRLRIVRRIEPQAATCFVPTFLLQPLVENAVRHGIAPLRRGGTLRIEANLKNDHLHIRVSDDGKGTSTIHESVGLGNTRARLKHMYGDKQSFDIETTAGGGFAVSIRVPR